MGKTTCIYATVVANLITVSRGDRGIFANFAPGYLGAK